MLNLSDFNLYSFQVVSLSLRTSSFDVSWSHLFSSPSYAGHSCKICYSIIQPVPHVPHGLEADLELFEKMIHRTFMIRAEQNDDYLLLSTELVEAIIFYIVKAFYHPIIVLLFSVAGLISSYVIYVSVPICHLLFLFCLFLHS